MSNISINISVNSTIGTRGSGNSQFDYPSGIAYFGGKIYVIDRQNQRVETFDTALNYLGKFGTYGTGAGQMNFPEGITIDESGHLYICQSANHRISKYQPNTLILDFGSKGSGHDRFNYPTDIVFHEDKIYVADKLNGKIKVYDVYANSSPTFLFEISGLNFPEGITIFNQKIYVTNSADKNIKVYDLGGTYLSTITNSNFVYPTGLININDEIICVIDKQGNSLYFYDFNGNYLSTYSTSIFYPEHGIYVNDKLYLTDSGNHRVISFNVNISHNIPIFSGALIRLTKQLYPTGRAWWMKNGGIFYRLHEALSYSEGRAYQVNKDLLNSILPDNDSFSEEDATNWESVFGIVSNSSISLIDRKKEISRRIEYPGNIPARQDAAYIQSQLQKAGFDVYVHENHSQVFSALYSSFRYGEMTYGSTGTDYPFTELCANHIKSPLDDNFDISNAEYKDFLFYVSGSTLPNVANVDIARKNEFRNLILTLKPANMVAVLLINYT